LNLQQYNVESISRSIINHTVLEMLQYKMAVNVLDFYYSKIHRQKPSTEYPGNAAWRYVEKSSQSISIDELGVYESQTFCSRRSHDVCRGRHIRCY
jgi:hypothetical protein